MKRAEAPAAAVAVACFELRATLPQHAAATAAAGSSALFTRGALHGRHLLREVLDGGSVLLLQLLQRVARHPQLLLQHRVGLLQLARADPVGMRAGSSAQEARAQQPGQEGG